MPQIARSLEERFWVKVKKTSSCWLWQGAIRATGHGWFHVNRSKSDYAHRIAWMLTYGPLLPGIVLCHQCGNATCVRPSHLAPGTQSDNATDGIRKARGQGKRVQWRRDHSLATRFWSKVLKTDTCWLWQGAHKASGYGHMLYNGRYIGAHRVAWILAHGEIPDGQIILHMCDTPACVRIEHLRLGTHADNAQDMVSKGRHNPVYGEANPQWNKRRTHCKYGHVLSEDNLIVYGRVRRCRTCTMAVGRRNALKYLHAHRDEVNAKKRARRAPFKTGPARGARHGIAKLTEAQIPLIRALHAEGKTSASIAAMFCVTPSNISQILSGKTWKHVP